MNDIKPKWLNVVRRMQSVVCEQRGYAVVTMKILVGPTGEPVIWLNPELQTIEPLRGSSEFLESLMDNL